MKFTTMRTQNVFPQLLPPDKEFIAELEILSGQRPVRCMQCGKCTAGCPAGFAYDYSVSQLMRLAQEGQKDALLGCKAIWLCLSCQTCGVRCPAGIDVPAVIDALRQMALKEKRVAEKAVNAFQQSFLDSAKRHGRIHELGLMLDYVRRTGRIFTDFDLGAKVLARRKLHFKGHDIQGREVVADIIRRHETMTCKG